MRRIDAAQPLGMRMQQQSQMQSHWRREQRAHEFIGPALRRGRPLIKQRIGISDHRPIASHRRAKRRWDIKNDMAQFMRGSADGEIISPGHHDAIDGDQRRPRKFRIGLANAKDSPALGVMDRLAQFPGDSDRSAISTPSEIISRRSAGMERPG